MVLVIIRDERIDWEIIIIYLLFIILRRLMIIDDCVVCMGSDASSVILQIYIAGDIIK